MTRPRRQQEDKVCCRDPNKIKKDYDDDNDFIGNYDFDDDMFNIDYEDMDQVYVYNMKTPYKDRQKDKKRKRKKKRKKSEPLTSLKPPNNDKKTNRDSLDFFTNG